MNAHLNIVANILTWYRQKLGADGMLGPLSWWQFVDWSWDAADSIRVGGVPPGASHGGSSIISLQYAYTLQRAAQLMNRFGKPELAGQYSTLAARITERTYALCWDASKGLLADDPGKKNFSQHANIMAVLTDAIPGNEQSALIKKIIADKTITPCTYYFSFYLFEALKKVNLGNLFLDLLGPWKTMLAAGLTTFAENPEPVRSDCHAWSASPNYEFLSLVLGVQPAAPGFEKVRIAPSPGSLAWVEGTVPHPAGNIFVRVNNSGEKGNAEVELPPGLTGEFIWKDKTYPLRPGKQKIAW